jgi:hypothetical protein
MTPLVTLLLCLPVALVFNRVRVWGSRAVAFYGPTRRVPHG